MNLILSTLFAQVNAMFRWWRGNHRKVPRFEASRAGSVSRAREGRPDRVLRARHTVKSPQEVTSAPVTCGVKWGRIKEPNGEAL